jgi:hypothetical protein
MNTNTKSRKWFIPFVVAPFLVFAIIGFIQLLKQRKPSWTEQGRQLSGTNAFAVWASASFSQIVPGEPLKQQVAAFQLMTNDSALSLEQEAKLRQSTYNLIMAFNTGDYEHYRKFRRPVPHGEWNKGLYKFRRTSLQKFWLKSRDVAELDEETVDRKFFEYLALTRGYTSDGVHVLAKGAESGKADQQEMGFLTGLSIENCTLSVEMRTNLPPAIDLIATKNENDGYFSAKPSFDFDISPQKALKLQTAVIFATVRLLVQSKRDKPMPLFYRLYWVEDYGEWLSYEHCIPSTFRVNYIIF